MFRLRNGCVDLEFLSVLNWISVLDVLFFFERKIGRGFHDISLVALQLMVQWIQVT